MCSLQPQNQSDGHILVNMDKFNCNEDLFYSLKFIFLPSGNNHSDGFSVKNFQTNIVSIVWTFHPGLHNVHNQLISWSLGENYPLKTLKTDSLGV